MIVTQLKRMRGTMTRRLQYRAVVFGLLLMVVARHRCNSSRVQVCT